MPSNALVIDAKILVRAVLGRVVPGPWIGPCSAEQAEEPVRPTRGNFTRTAQLAPTVLDDGEIVNPVVLDRPPEAIQPLVARLSVRGRLDRDRQQFLRAQYTAPPSAPDEVSTA